MTRISAGVDVSKNRSTVCIMDQDGKVIMRPFLVWHSTEELDFLADTLKRLNGEVRVIMESTSIYQYPIALHLKEKGIFISIVNAYKVKKFANTDFRGGKTDKKDSRTIASYGISYWDKLVEWQIPKDTYFNLDLLNRTYMNAKKHRQIILQELQHYIDCAMPGMDNRGCAGWGRGHFYYIPRNNGETVLCREWIKSFVLSICPLRKTLCWILWRNLGIVMRS